MTSVVLVVPPFASLVRPALGVSTLKAAVEARGIPCRVDYLGFDFARLLGTDDYELVADLAPSFLAGEWAFAAALAGPGRRPEEARYLAQIQELLAGDDWGRVLKARRLATAFVREQAERLAQSGARVLGFTTSFQQNCAGLALAREVKARAPRIEIVFGGPNCEGPMGRALLAGFPQVDHVFGGESDHTFPDFVERCLAGERPYSRDPSVLSRGRSPGEPESRPVHDLDALPVPDFTDYLRSLEAHPDRERIHAALPFESSRGCWWGQKHHCTFCGLNGTGMVYRRKSPARVLEELRELRARHGIASFAAADNILDHRLARELFGRFAAEGGDQEFFYEIKSNISAELLELMARGGVSWVQPGIESLADETLASMDKGVSGLQNVELLRNCAELGVRPTWNVLTGFPGDRREHYERMARIIEHIEHLMPPSSMSPFRIDRFSPAFERAAELGITGLQPFLGYRVIYDLPDELVRDIAYFFEGEVPDLDDGDYTAPAREAVQHWTATYFSGARARLELDERGRGSIVEDSRSRARQRHTTLSALERQVLADFRGATSIERAVARAGEEAYAAAVERMLELAFLVEDRGRAVSVVVELARRVRPAAGDPMPVPLGFLRPPAQEAPRRPQPTSLEVAT